MDHADARLSFVAAAIGEPSRSRMLCCLLDGHARTSTELAAVAGIGGPTASAHLLRMKEAGLLQLIVQGRHRYYRLASPEVGRALEALLVVSNHDAPPFRPSTPRHLQSARSCYDHLAGEWGVAWHDRLLAMKWLQPAAGGNDYLLGDAGREALAELGLGTTMQGRRRFAYPCLDWSMRRPHLGGALGAALLDLGVRRGWLRRQLDGRALTVTVKGHRDLDRLFGVSLG
ncbi:helix-turn-helix transcriptional regulator [Pinirhizobacter sp.]|jgi:DNA-binding transcriptional ArsR family regulator|uniref:ArsR/SmtB family transcription factor n=1 Tax=Pinirhizobacter sp. TaxID=2950432 RepID=UPI002F3F3EBF